MPRYSLSTAWQNCLFTVVKNKQVISTAFECLIPLIKWFRKKLKKTIPTMIRFQILIRDHNFYYWNEVIYNPNKNYTCFFAERMNDSEYYNMSYKIV